MEQEFYSNGKLLLTGEYAVLDGALALAVPTRYGQSLSIKEVDPPQLIWESRDENGHIWFENVFDLNRFPSPTLLPNNNPIAETLLKILGEAQKLNPDFLAMGKGYQVEAQLSFPRNWGLGSSSTLINNIAQWAQIDAFELLWNAFSGSGYDIACAQHDHPILYRLKRGIRHSEHTETAGRSVAEVQKVHFNPPFQSKLYFVHLNRKQDSREGIATYRKMDFDKPHLLQRISEITQQTVSSQSLSEFESLMMEHETLLSRILKMPTVKESLFPDFKGAIKSLGAWGGDFIIASGDESTPSYFKKKGYKTILPYSKIIL